MPDRLYVITLDRILKWLTIMAAGRRRHRAAAAGRVQEWRQVHGAAALQAKAGLRRAHHIELK